MNFKEFLYFSLFSSVKSAALNTIQISYGMSYFRHRDSSDIFTYDIARQSVVDKMVREISLEVREKSGNLFSHFWWEPCIVTRVYKVVVVVRSGGCHCLGNHVLLQVRATIVALPSGDMWGDGQFCLRRSMERYYRYLVVL